MFSDEKFLKVRNHPLLSKENYYNINRILTIGIHIHLAYFSAGAPNVAVEFNISRI